MFEGATSFNAILGFWNVSKVINMISMFKGATSFEGSLKEWEWKPVCDVMTGSMFENSGVDISKQPDFTDPENCTKVQGST